MDIQFLTTEGIAALPAGRNRVAVIYTTRNEIDTCNAASAVDRLLELSDNRQHVCDFSNAVAWIVNGFDADRRELYEIPEVRRYFQAVDDLWPHWGYFGVEETGDLTRFLTFLCSVEVVRGPGRLVGAALDPHEVCKHINRWRTAIHHLADHHGVHELAAQRLAALDRITAQFPV